MSNVSIRASKRVYRLFNRSTTWKVKRPRNIWNWQHKTCTRIVTTNKRKKRNKQLNNDYYTKPTYMCHSVRFGAVFKNMRYINMDEIASKCRKNVPKMWYEPAAVCIWRPNLWTIRHQRRIWWQSQSARVPPAHLFSFCQPLVWKKNRIPVIFANSYFFLTKMGQNMRGFTKYETIQLCYNFTVSWTLTYFIKTKTFSIKMFLLTRAEVDTANFLSSFSHWWVPLSSCPAPQPCAQPFAARDQPVLDFCTKQVQH